MGVVHEHRPPSLLLSILSSSRGMGSRLLVVATTPVRGRQWLLLGLAIILFLWFYYYIAGELIRHVNQDRSASDQQLHISLAHSSHQDWWPLRTDGITNPFWSWIATFFDDGDDEAVFVRGKWFNVIATAAFLAGLTCWSARRLPLLAAINLLLVAALGLFLQRCTYFQPEPLYYIFFFFCWTAACALLRHNPLWLYGLLGLCSVLAYLLKPSTAPLMLIFVGVSTLRCVHSWWHRNKRTTG